VKAHAPIDAIDKNLQTPLHLASRGGHVDAICALIELGASLRAKDSKGMNPLAVAVMAGQMRSCEAIINSPR